MNAAASVIASIVRFIVLSLLCGLAFPGVQLRLGESLLAQKDSAPEGFSAWNHKFVLGGGMGVSKGLTRGPGFMTTRDLRKTYRRQASPQAKPL
jgi:hypothetical protein